MCKIRTTLKVVIEPVMRRSVVMNKYPSAFPLGGQVDIEEEAIRVVIKSVVLLSTHCGHLYHQMCDK